MSQFTWTQLLARARTDVLWDGLTADQRYSDDQLLRFANTFIAASYPMLWVPKVDTSLYTTQTAGIQTYTNRRYALPAAVPQTEFEGFPIYMIEIGPIGGERISDSLAFTDEYYPPVQGKFFQKAWRIQRTVSSAGAETNTLVFAPWVNIPYDPAGTYKHWIRLHYAGDIPLLTTGSDVFQGPDNAVPALLQWMHIQGNEANMRQAQNDPDRLAGLGGIARYAKERVDDLVENWGCRMQRPRIIR